MPLEIVAFGPEAVAAHGRVRASRERAGTPIGPLDTPIAAHAVSLGVTLFADNVREFECVPNLDAEDWTRTERPP